MVGRWVALLFTLGCAAAWAQAPAASGFIVKLRPGTTLREAPSAARERLAAVARANGVDTVEQRALGGSHHVLRLARPVQGAALDATLRRLRLHPDVAAVEPDVRETARLVPNDPDFVAQQWHLQVPGVNAAAINMPPAWDRSTGGNNVIAILDTGVRFTHPDLQGRLLSGYDFVSEVEFANDGDGRDADASDPGDWVTNTESRSGVFAGCQPENSSWHGTFIAGQLAALTNNALGVAGVSWGARVLPVRISGKCGALLSDILDGIRWAAGLAVAGVPTNPNPARIINLSFGGSVACSSSYQDVIDEITAAGSLLVVAAGNEGGTPTRPADCRGVLSVGAVRAEGAKASYSNLGPAISLVAPGGASSTDSPIYSTGNGGTQGPSLDNYIVKSGTSFAAPLAAGVASLMLSVNPALSPAQLLARLRAGTRAHIVQAQLPTCSVPFGAACNCTTSTCGSGLLDGALALAQAANPLVAISAPTTAAPLASVTLDGRSSSAASGATIQSYQWTQTAGTAASLRNANTALASVTLPSQAGSFTFTLRVQDSTGASSADSVTISSGSAVSGSTGGSGGGASPLELAALLLVAALAALRERRRQGNA